MALVLFRRHQAVLPGSWRKPVPTGSANPLHARGDEGAGHRKGRRRAIPSRRWWPRSNGCATRLQTALKRQQKNPDRNERMRAQGKRDRPTHQSTLDGERGRPTAGPRATLQRPPADQGLLQDLQQRLDGLGRQGKPGADLPVEPRSGRGDGKGLRRRRGAARTNGARWVEPTTRNPRRRTAAAVA